MRRTRLTWGGLLGLTSLLVGCAVAPTRYYSLATPAAEQPVGAPVAMHGDDVRVVVTSMPPDTDRPQLVVRDPGGQAAVQVLNESLWAAPLDEQIRAVLTDELSRHRAASGNTGPADQGGRRIAVSVDRFDMVWEQFVALDAHWTDRQPGAADSRQCRASIRVSANGGDVAALVEAQRHALARLGTLMAEPSIAPAADAHDAMLTSESGCT